MGIAYRKDLYDPEDPLPAGRQAKIPKRNILLGFIGILGFFGFLWS